MPDPVSALRGASFNGFATIREIGPIGMITLRSKELKTLDKAVKAAVGAKLPAQRRIEASGDKACAWMSPDEYLLILPYAEVGAALASLTKSLSGEHYLAVDVSDARAVFRIEGDKAAQALQKLSPVDFTRLEAGEIRRSRAAQVAAAFWYQDGGYTLVCFRSVAGYVMGLLCRSSAPGSELA
jgi:sarcosine oxidase subunit gamma